MLLRLNTMKTERRHELQTNKLADWTGHQLEQLRPHGKLLLGALVLGVAVVIAAIVLINDSQAAQSRAWNDYYLALAARDRDALANVAKAHAGTDVALWSRQSQADIDLTSGISSLYTSRDDALRSLNDASDAYAEILTQRGTSPEMRRHAMLGLAQAGEARSNLEEARKNYEKLVEEFPGTPEAGQASARLVALKDPQVEKFYGWFERQKPQPAATSAFPNLPGMPDSLTDLPDRPEGPLLPLPGSTPPDGKPVDGAAATRAPAESSKAAAEGAPPGAAASPKSDGPAPVATPAVPGTSPAANPAEGSSSGGAKPTVDPPSGNGGTGSPPAAASAPGSSQAGSPSK